MLAIHSINWNEPEEFKLSLQAILCKNFSQYYDFDVLYAEYWSEFNGSVDSKVKNSKKKDEIKPKTTAPSIEVIKSWLHGNKPMEETELTKASSGVSKNKLEFNSFSEEQVREWKTVITLLQNLIDRQPSRRYISSSKSKQLDLRNTLLKNLRYGNEIIKLKHKEKKKSRIRIVLLCDVSKSMQLYSKFMIQMMYHLQNSRLDIQTFTFSTSLFHITNSLKKTSLKQTIKSISNRVDEWSSGTKIGECLEDFNKRYKSKYIDHKTIIFVISDGWESGDLNKLDSSLKLIKKKVNKLFWINPLAHSSSFKPEVLGMKTAMKYIDFLIPALEVGQFKKYLGHIN